MSIFTSTKESRQPEMLVQCLGAGLENKEYDPVMCGLFAAFLNAPAATPGSGDYRHSLASSLQSTWSQPEHLASHQLQHTHFHIGIPSLELRGQLGQAETTLVRQSGMESLRNNSSRLDGGQSGGSSGEAGNTHGTAAAEDNDCNAPESGGVPRTFTSDIFHPDAFAGERERQLQGALVRARSEIQELQAHIRTLFNINLRYAEQLQQTIAAAAPQPKRRRTGGRHITDSPLPSEPTAAASTQVFSLATPPSSSTQPLPPHPQLVPPLYLSHHRLRTPSYSHAVSASLGIAPQIYRTMQPVPGLLAAVSSQQNPAITVALSSAPLNTVGIASSAPGSVSVTATQEGVTRLDPAATMASSPLSAPAAPFSRTHVQGSASAQQRLEIQPQPDTGPVTLEPGTNAQGGRAQWPNTSSVSAAAGSRTTQTVDIDSLAIGDSENIPSIGKFSSPRALYRFRQRISEYEQTNGAQWREKMDSKRRQNWSRISAVYNRIMQLRGESSDAADLERALQAAEDEMSASAATLTRYSQLVRKRLNSERRQNLHASQPQPAHCHQADHSLTIVRDPLQHDAPLDSNARN
ncbi:hypothetical protein COEREDRAFT_9450 [Coemansia reversa NRRL 1564]|uniref:Uncharacterized protein n=1 Tax=Coemansia reversa (strain ATCC 12441 / NRRL 1564) TaxID=763665 RepID=A0A2G5B8H1_COERN|nr:hypothetical protein COEREDRAFT_9450 [Coemansia reversa NRRL 1564]|eukprot:PIA15305.1 hypothetical protein COEREDRAFT_9450 [Coemansia reversa NRRL 1564]